MHKIASFSGEEKASFILQVIIKMKAEQKN